MDGECMGKREMKDKEELLLQPSSPNVNTKGGGGRLEVKCIVLKYIALDR
jgi:hypothetical protein